MVLKYFWSFILVVSFLVPHELFSGPIAARVVEVKGFVYILEGTKKSQAMPGQDLNPLAKIQTSDGAFLRLLLADGSAVKLGSNTKIELSKLSGKESGNTEINVESGEIKAAVKKKPGLPRHFGVRTPTATMGVRGTQFLVQVSEISPGKIRSDFTCMSGAVAVFDLKGKEMAELKGGTALAVAGVINAQGEVRVPASMPIIQQLSPSQVEKLNKDIEQHSGKNTSSGSDSVSGSKTMENGHDFSRGLATAPNQAMQVMTGTFGGSSANNMPSDALKVQATGDVKALSTSMKQEILKAEVAPLPAQRSMTAGTFSSAPTGETLHGSTPINTTLGMTGGTITSGGIATTSTASPTGTTTTAGGNTGGYTVPK